MSKRYLYIPILIILSVFTALAQNPSEIFQVVACRKAAVTRGDSLHRMVYYFSFPAEYSGKAFLRIFDADLEGKFDQWTENSQVVYRVFGKGNIDRNLWAISDDLEKRTHLIKLSLSKSQYYDNRWRTIGELPFPDSEDYNGRKIFQLVVDGISGSARNLYQIYISSDEKRNVPIEGLEINAPVMTVRLPGKPELATQLKFFIPENTDTIEVFNFDSDFETNRCKVFFESSFRQGIPISSSRDGSYSKTSIPVEPREQGAIAAILVIGNRSVNNIQFWIKDKKGNLLPFVLPTLIGKPNHLPEVKFSFIPLSKCFTGVFDASGTKDADGDELSYEWNFPGGKQLTGSRIVYDFGKAGRYEIKLIVRDNSGFVANTTRVSKEIVINFPPEAVILAPDKGVPNDFIEFDASKSSDIDGKVIKAKWNFGDGTSAEGFKVQHRFLRPGEYQVTLTVEDDGNSLCSTARAKHKIWINDPPIAKIDAKNLAAVDEPVQLSAEHSIDSDGEIVKYSWDFGDNSSASGVNVTHQWKKPGRYRVVLKVEDDAGLTNSRKTDEMEMIINAPPVPVAKFPGVTSANETILFSASDSKDPDGQIIGYVWNFGDGKSAKGEKVSHQYIKPGLYTITLRTIDNSETQNNQTEKQFPIRINFPPKPAFMVDSVINTSTVEFDASLSRDEDDEIINYFWDFGDGQKGEGVQITHIYRVPGTYNVTLKVKDASGTSSSERSVIRSIRVNQPPIADAGGDYLIAPGETMVLNAGFSEDIDGEIVSYQWKLSDGRVFSGEKIDCQFSNPGEYTADLQVTDNDGALGIDHSHIVVNYPPEPYIFPVSRIAPEEEVVFDGSGSFDADGKIISYEWNFGDGSAIANGMKVKHVFKEPGRYQVKLMVQDDSGAMNNKASYMMTVEVNYPPVPVMAEDISTCDQTVIFDASESRDSDGDMLTYFWEFGDGSKGTGIKITHDYLNSGIYPVTLTVDDGMNLKNSVSRTHTKILINSPPIAIIKVNRVQLCAGEPAIFDASGSSDREEGLLRYLWDFGDGETAEGINPVHSFPGGGDYNVRLTVIDDSDLPCNSSVVEQVIHVIDAPVARAGEDKMACANSIVDFDASASTGGGRQIQSFEWDFGDGKSGGGLKTTHIYSEPGIYTVYLRITVPIEGDCNNSSEDELKVEVVSAPSANFSVKEEGCPGEAITFDASSSLSGGTNIEEYIWDFGDGTTGSGKIVMHSYQASGNYEAKLTVRTDSDQGCNTSSCSRFIRINALPEAEFQMAKADADYNLLKEYYVNLNEFVRFNALGSHDPDGYIRKYFWLFGDGNSQEGASVRHQYTKPGNYQVKLKITDDSNTPCNTDSAFAKIVVTEKPVLKVVSVPEICVNAEAVFKAVIEKGEKITPDELEWVFSDGETAKGLEVWKSFEKAGIYQAQVRWKDVNSNAVKIRVVSIPEIILPEKVEAYSGDRVGITPEYTNPFALPLIFHWDFEGVEKVDREKASVIFNKPGNFSAALTVKMEGNACDSVKYKVPIKIYKAPEAEIRMSKKIGHTGGARDEIEFEGIVTAERAGWIMLWDFGDGESALGELVQHVFKRPGKYKVTLTLKDATHLTDQKFDFSKEIEIKER